MSMKPDPARMLSLILATWLGLAAAAHAGPGQVQSGHYTIYYNALSGDALPRVSTKAYGLRHAPDQGLVTLAVNAGHGDNGSNVTFDVSGHASTLLGKPVPLTFRHFDDHHGNHSVLVSFTVSGNETVRFDLDVTPHGASTTHLHFVHSYGP